MEIVMLGLDARHAPIAILEKLTFNADSMATAYNQLMGKAVVEEAVIVTTCNRVEIYVLTEHASLLESQRQINHFLADFHQLPEAEFTPFLQNLSGYRAVQHLFEVAAGLQSVVLGEPQIQGQLKEAIDQARTCKGAGRVTEALFRAAIVTGKRARNETKISENSVSVSRSAIALLERYSQGFAHQSALIVGAGDTARLSAIILQSRGVKRLGLVNRNPENALKLAQELAPLEVQIYSMEQLSLALQNYDSVVCCTAAPHPVISRQMLLQVAATRHTPLILADIAMPRDVECSGEAVAGVKVIDMDDIRTLSEESLARRQEEVSQVQQIIGEEIAAFYRWLGSLAVVPTITALRQHSENIRQHELERMLPALGKLEDRQLKLLEELTSRLVNKLLHEPTTRLKAAAHSTDAARYAEIVQYLFGLPGASQLPATSPHSKVYNENANSKNYGGNAGQPASPDTNQLAD